MTTLDLVLTAAVLGGSLVSRTAARLAPPPELLQNLDLLDDLPLLEGGAEAP